MNFSNKCKLVKAKKWPGSAEEFQQNDMIVLPEDFFTEKLKLELAFEAHTLLGESAELRKLEMISTANTPRHYRSVGRDAIHAHNGAIRELFENNDLLDALTIIAGEPVFRVPYKPEEYIVNNQCGVGHTHGWHWDDYSFALVHVVEAPDPIYGGRVEMIRRINWEKNDTATCIRMALNEKVVLGQHVASHQTYLMRTNTTLHRISPLTGQTNRIAIIMSYASESDLHDSRIAHDTMEAIYPKDTRMALA